MALKAGTENKRNVAIAGGLLCVVAYLGISQLMSGPPKPAPGPAPTQPPVVRTAPNPADAQSGRPAQPARTVVAARNSGSAAGPDARKLQSSGLDPSLHLEKLLASESIEYAGDGRNIFSADSAPRQIEEPLKSARTEPQVPIQTGPPPPPQPPPIDLHYFGYSASHDGKRQAFLQHGDDIFLAMAGEIVNHRFKVVAVDTHSVQITDLSYNNTQTLPLTN